ncbi:cellulose binding domain-containing protein [Streptosporangiaceae bacterium NEAU-GS5]|nr:cellulose binding domain-containing protein [Streptosporangiaceae bacterium NEAU-GS5]
MMRTRRVLRCLTAGLMLGASLVLGTGVAGAESNGGVRVMPLGDSITDGFTVAGGYRIDLWQKLVTGGFTVDFVGSLFNGPAALGDHDHEGHSGWRIDQIDANIVNWLRTFTPRTILLHIGTNDMIQNPSGAPARLGTLLDHITSTAPDAEVFVATIIPLSGSDANVRAFNSAIPGLVQTRAAAGRHIHLVDMFSALTTADLADGVHPNAGGYSKMATVWFNALRSVPGALTPIGTGGDTTVPSAPANLAASGTTSTSTGLSWTASTDNVGVTGYDILRATGATGGTFAQVGTSATTSFTNTGLTANTTYRYQVRARDAAGNLSAVSNITQVTTQTGGTTPGACTATPTVQSQWGTGYVIQPMTVTNTSTSTINSWTVTFTLPAGHTLTGSWNVTVTTSGQTITAKSVSHNGTLAPGASTTSFGFQAARPNGNTSLPSGYTCATP